ncbi:NAD(P)-binding protein [Bartonella sp. DGB2]|uniref:NAD(P)-binding protein n=1 Tax=Bartonella sp. DGB2 TaxID=3388426 RepID=UPI00398FDC6C
MKPSVVIVGAGIADCACAILLAQRGFEVRLLDHRIASNSYKTLCTHFIQPFTNDILHELRLSHLLTSAYSIAH